MRVSQGDSHAKRVPECLETSHVRDYVKSLSVSKEGTLKSTREAGEEKKPLRRGLNATSEFAGQKYAGGQ